MKDTYFIVLGYKSSKDNSKPPVVTASLAAQLHNIPFKGFFRNIKKIMGPTFIKYVPKHLLDNGFIEVVNITYIGKTI